MHRLPALVLTVWLVVVAGCGASYVSSPTAADNTASSQKEEQPATVTATDDSGSLAGETQGDSPRKIIYTATVNLVVKDFSETTGKIKQLVQQYKGYVAQFREDRFQGRQLSGDWTVRIPVDRVDDFLAALDELGVPEVKEIDASDVTEEFVDLEARLKNQRKFEARLLEMLEKQTGKLPDVIAVETKLNDVRESIERMQGRLNYLKNKTTLTTVTIHAREQKDYTPPQAPNFGEQIAGAWFTSLDALRRFGENAVLVAVRLTPWLPVILVVVGLPLLLIRRMFRRVMARFRTAG